jgi:hypothetical protein
VDWNPPIHWLQIVAGTIGNRSNFIPLSLRVLWEPDLTPNFVNEPTVSHQKIFAEREATSIGVTFCSKAAEELSCSGER